MEEERKVFGIYHSHTKYSKFNHGKNTVEEMCDEARRLGLVEYAITDHSFKHVFGITKKNIKKLREKIDKENEKEGTKILMGLEMNLLSKDGKADFPEKYADILDIKLLGMHKAGMVSFKSFFNFILPNLFNGKSQKVIEMNTDAYISAIKRYNIDLITHPQEYIKVNLTRLGNACATNNCFLEINNKHLKYTKEDMEELLKTDVKFLVSSDAHRVSRLASVEEALAFAETCGVPKERIANLAGEINFKSKY